MAVESMAECDRNTQVAQNIQKKYPEAERGPSLWAFPIRPGHAVIGRVFEIPVYYLFISLALAMFIAESRLSLGLVTIFVIASLFFLPIIISGLLSSFSGWPFKPGSLMVFPVAVFLNDISNILDEK